MLLEPAPDTSKRAVQRQHSCQELPSGQLVAHCAHGSALQVLEDAHEERRRCFELVIDSLPKRAWHIDEPRNVLHLMISACRVLAAA